jgi:hypothetical protein
VRRKIAIALVTVAAVAGVWVGFWEAQFWVPSVGECPLPVNATVANLCMSMPAPAAQPEFAWWLCALLGGGAAALVALIALAVDRWPEATYSS